MLKSSRPLLILLVSLTLIQAQQPPVVPPPGFGPTQQPQPAKPKPQPPAEQPEPQRPSPTADPSAQPPGRLVPQPRAVQPPSDAAPATDPAQAAPTQTAPPPAAVPTADGGFVLNLQNADLLQVVDMLAQRLKINYILDPRVKGGVTINTYGELREVDLRQLLETILRVNGATIIQVGNLYRIVPIADAARLPIAPMVNATEFPPDEQMVLNLIFLKYMTSSEISNLLQPFVGEGATVTSYDAANLLIVLDNSRNMGRTMELIGLLDSDTFASRRVRVYEIKNSNPGQVVKELEAIFKQLAMSKSGGAVQFLALERTSSILAFAPNPGAFDLVEDWIKRLDITAETAGGTPANYVYKVKYTRAEILAMVINGLYGGGGGMGMGMGGYGGFGYGGGGGFGGGFGGGGYGGGGFGGGGPFGGGAGMGGMYGFGANRNLRRGGGIGGGGGGAGAYGNPGGAPLIGVRNPTGPVEYAYSNYTGPGGIQPAGTGTGAAAGGTAAVTVPSNAAGGSVTGSNLTGSYLGAGQDQYGYYGPRIIANPFDNSLLIQATGQEYDQILKLLVQMDVPPRQVLIEAKIFDVSLTGTFASGVTAALTKRSGVNRQFLGTSTGSGVNLSAGMLIGQSRELLAILTATAESRQAKLISAPNLIATDSIPANINVGQEVPVLTAQALNPAQPGDGNLLFANSIANRSTGVTLEILAMINPSGIVTMIIDQEVSAPQAPAANAAIQSPSFSTRNVSTQVTVRDGDTIAIGGIIQESESDSSAGIPFLHDLPGIGGLFGSKSRSRSRSELVIFLTPRVIYDSNHVVDATEELKSKLRLIQREIDR